MFAHSVLTKRHKSFHLHTFECGVTTLSVTNTSPNLRFEKIVASKFSIFLLVPVLSFQEKTEISVLV